MTKSQHNSTSSGNYTLSISGGKLRNKLKIQKLKSLIFIDLENIFKFIRVDKLETKSMYVEASIEDFVNVQF
jgi:hypothetical protein